MIKIDFIKDETQKCADEVERDIKKYKFSEHQILHIRKIVKYVFLKAYTHGFLEGQKK